MTTTIGRAAVDPGTVVVHGNAAGFAQAIAAGGHRLIADEPMSVGGTDTGPTPYDLLLAAIGSCTSMTLTMYARRKAWPLEAVTITLRHSKIHAADCEACETRDARVGDPHPDPPDPGVRRRLSHEHGSKRRLMIASLRYIDTFVKAAGVWLLLERPEVAYTPSIPRGRSLWKLPTHGNPMAMPRA